MGNFYTLLQHRGPYLWIYIRTEKGRMIVLHKTYYIGLSIVYLVFLVSTKIWNTVFFKQLVIILLCQTLFPKKRKRKVSSRNGKRLDVSVCITITVMLKYQTTYHVLSGLSSSFQMNLSRNMSLIVQYTMICIHFNQHVISHSLIFKKVTKLRQLNLKFIVL